MEIVNLGFGLKSYQLVEGGEPLTFAEGDPNLYARFINAVDEIKAVEAEQSKKAKAIPEAGESEESKLEYGKQSLNLLMETDRKVKDILGRVFVGNDFDKIMRGMNLMAANDDGDRAIELIIDFLLPKLEAGAKRFAGSEVKTARLNREQRRKLGV